ncbi:TRAP transporter small permease [Pseudolabrys sp. FHR47]|uniref:TRAP transporter small permease n=1 Tax=Pseudolabrys sp. FHR47 TaxID=2562284 RepID=UPI0010BF41E4|nr:TRAP transporter small permease [Pseudolabrys sp. FHR47]
MSDATVIKPQRDVVAVLGRIQLWLAGFAIIAMMLVTVADVFMRYVFNNPVRGAYDFTEAMLVVFVFNSMAPIFLARANIVIDLIDTAISPQVRRVLVTLSDLVSLALLFIFSYAAIVPALQAFESGERKLQLALPLWALWIVMFAGLFGTIVCALGAIFLRSWRDQDTGHKL